MLSKTYFPNYPTFSDEHVLPYMALKGLISPLRALPYESLKRLL